jgi:hypothetical protein
MCRIEHGNPLFDTVLEYLEVFLLQIGKAVSGTPHHHRHKYQFSGAGNARNFLRATRDRQVQLHEADRQRRAPAHVGKHGEHFTTQPAVARNPSRTLPISGL